MALSCCIDLSPTERETLLAIARRSIRAGLAEADKGAQDPSALTPALREERPVFVTLTRGDRLRGCIGTLEPVAALARAVADAAFDAAFRDARFPRLQAGELPGTSIEISVLSPMTPVAADSRNDLIARLRAGEDGLCLQDGQHRATFLPKVWEQLPEPEAFLDQLLAKAGLSPGHWSPSLRVHRYRTLTFSDSRGSSG